MVPDGCRVRANPLRMQPPINDNTAAVRIAVVSGLENMGLGPRAQPPAASCLGSRSLKSGQLTSPPVNSILLIRDLTNHNAVSDVSAGPSSRQDTSK